MIRPHGVTGTILPMVVAGTIKRTDGGAGIPVRNASPAPTRRECCRRRARSRAALAAIHIAVRTDAAVGACIFEPTIAEQAIGVDQPALLEQTRTTAAQQAVPARLTGRFSDPVFRFVGVRFDAATPDRVVLYLATAAEDATGTTVYGHCAHRTALGAGGLAGRGPTRRPLVHGHHPDRLHRGLPVVPPGDRSPWPSRSRPGSACNRCRS